MSISEEDVIKVTLEEITEHIHSSEEKLLSLEKEGYDKLGVDFIFRAIHTVKSLTAAFPVWNKASVVAHKMESILSFLRNRTISTGAEVIDSLLQGLDLLRKLTEQDTEPEKIDTDVYNSYMDDYIINIKSGKKTAASISFEAEREEQLSLAQSFKKNSEEEAKNQGSDRSLRVSLDLMDRLMALTEEMVLYRNELNQKMQNNNYPELEPIIRKVSLNVTSLQENIARTRLLNVNRLFDRIPRVVRDLTREGHKKVHLEISGGEIELDREIIEIMSEPLIHLIRNAVDHGIESRAERREAGKKEEALLDVRAFHQGGQVYLEIKDDGGGINVERIYNKALAKNLISKSDSLSEKEKLDLIFLPGLSTRDEVTSTSGRGVGMDIIKSSIEKLGGKIETNSTWGKGTTFRLQLPLTLAIMSGLVVRVGSTRLIIPQANVSQLIRLEESDQGRKIEKVGDRLVLRLEEHLVPVIRLADTLGIQRLKRRDNHGDLELDRRENIIDRRIMEGSDVNSDWELKKIRKGPDRRQSEMNRTYIVVLKLGFFQYALIVDEILDVEEIVAKPLGFDLRDSRIYSGASILGDGTVAMILDASGFAEFSGLNAEEILNIQNQSVREEEITRTGVNLLFFGNGTEDIFGIATVNNPRVLRIALDEIHRVGGIESINVGQNTIPVIRIEDYLPLEAGETPDYYHVIIYNFNERYIGVLAHSISEFNEVHPFVETDKFRGPGTLGTAVLEGKSVIMLDLYSLIDCKDSGWFDKSQASADPKKILLIEDDSYFQAMLNKYLTSGGFEFTTVNSLAEGLERDQNEDYNILLSDLDMPEMNRSERLNELKERAKGREAKMIGVISASSVSSNLQDDEIWKTELKKVYGTIFDDYLIKEKREQLYATLGNA